MRLKIRDNVRTIWFGVNCHVSLWHLSYRRSSSRCIFFCNSSRHCQVHRHSIICWCLAAAHKSKVKRNRTEFVLSFSSFFMLCVFFTPKEKIRSLMAFWHSETVSHFFYTSCVSVTMPTRLWNMNWSISVLTLKLRAISIINSKINIFIFLYLSTNSHKWNSIRLQTVKYLNTINSNYTNNELEHSRIFFYIFCIFFSLQLGSDLLIFPCS